LCIPAVDYQKPLESYHYKNFIGLGLGIGFYFILFGRKQTKTDQCRSSDGLYLFTEIYKRRIEWPINIEGMGISNGEPTLLVHCLF